VSGTYLSFQEICTAQNIFFGIPSNSFFSWAYHTSNILFPSSRAL